MSRSRLRPLARLTVNDLVKVLTDRGWKTIRSEGAKNLVILSKPGLGSRTVVLPLHSGEVPPVVLDQICRAVGVTKEELIDA